MNTTKLENDLEDEVIAYEEEPEEEEIDIDEESSVNIPIDGSPLYPRIYVGDSALPLQGQFNQSEYVDDNITRTWTGILTSYYG